MSSNKSTKKAPSPVGINWQTNLLRATVFFEHTRPREEGVWTKLLDTLPEDKIIKPAEGSVLESGAFMDATLHLISRQDRADIILQPNATKALEAGLTDIGTYTDAIGDFNKLTNRWLTNHKESVTRIAQAVTLIHKVEGRDNGYKSLGKLLHSIQMPDAEDASDFRFTINRPRESRNKNLEKLKINRLTQWSCIQQTVFFFQGGADGSALRKQANSQAQYVMAEIDVNTDKDYTKAIPENELVNLYNELNTLSEEISKFGDIP